ncbi:hypothetical protein NLJ89_g10506 [Agrocybe chaxingu]|uniref:Uncharacterized protein n=1 Tax=Agrocybe chaxingu TaxID=84603 RepID=A0A9W8JR59_9AGAR|nr:hypothetical protein NLJ89_g10506 [Agrocybe chaxingu]
MNGSNISEHVLLSVMHSDWRLLSFGQTWLPFGFNPFLHFILIFRPKQWCNIYAPVLTQAQNVNYVLPSPGQTATRDLDSDIRPYSSFTSSDNLEQPWHHASPASWSAGVTTYSSLEDYLTHLPINSFDIQNAIFLDTDTEAHIPLVVMVQNWRSMTNVLDVLGLNTKSSEKKLTLDLEGNICKLSALDVLEHFHWGLVSFNHKTLWYRWAFVAARQKWANPSIYSMDSKVQSRISKEEERLFKLWRGICFLFRPGGAVDKGIKPMKQTGDYDERQAATLSQSNIRKYKAAMSRYLTN